MPKFEPFFVCFRHQTFFLSALKSRRVIALGRRGEEGDFATSWKKSLREKESRLVNHFTPLVGKEKQRRTLISRKTGAVFCFIFVPLPSSRRIQMGELKGKRRFACSHDLTVKRKEKKLKNHELIGIFLTAQHGCQICLVYCVHIRPVTNLFFSFFIDRLY